MLRNVQDSSQPVAGDVAHAMQHKHGFAYAYLDEKFNIVQTSPNFRALVPDNEAVLEGEPVTAVLWEFFGSEKDLSAVADGTLPVFKLNHINRELANGEMVYLDYIVVRANGRTPQAALFLLIEDETELGTSQQHLMQERNELKLLRGQLLATNQQLEETLTIKDLFLQMVSHDLRTPLSVIVGYATFLERNAGMLTEQKAKNMLHTIIHQTDRLNYLIEDMITLDRFEKGTVKLEIEHTLVSQSINEVIDALRVIAERKQIVITYHMPEQPIFAHFDLQRFWQIAYNLIGNSIKYTREGGAIDVYTTTTETDFVFEVIDNGFGIAEEHIPYLFELFYRTEEAEKGRSSGSGIGLYIVKKIVEAHRGKIFVESTLDEGSRFMVLIPLSLPKQIESKPLHPN